MKILALTICFLFQLLITGYSQSSENSKLNLDFELNTGGYPEKWGDFGSKNCQIYVDSVYRQNGKYSVVIENKGDSSNYKALKIALPENYKGKIISLSGYIKTENVTAGYAGLWMSINPQIAMENMGNNGIIGTTSWKKYEIKLSLNPRRTDEILFGGLLVGKGKMWLDNLRITIDGKDLDDKSLEIYHKEMLPAEKDKAFDNGSGISFPKLTVSIINNLELLGKVWGFLKYHHPEIAKGNYNWDYELFRMLSGYLKVKNNQERDRLLISWIKKYGDVPACDSCKATRKDAVLKPDLTWLENGHLSPGLKMALKKIYINRNQGENFYIAIQKNIGNPEFTNENSYTNMPYPDDGFRLLALYRYWNMIEYFYPNRDLTNKRWNTVLKDYISSFLYAKDELQYELAALKIIGEVDDTHATLLGGRERIEELRGSNFAPFKAAFIQNKFVVTDYYNPEFSEIAKLKIGDVITHINGKAIESIVDSLKIYYPASNEGSRLRDISTDLLRSSKNEINIRYLSENQNKEQVVTLYDLKHLNFYNWYKVNKDEKCFKILNGNIGYVTLANIQDEDVPEIKESFKNTKGIIIDIRNYPSAYVISSLVSYFVTEATAFVKLTQGNPDNPGEFTFTDPLKIGSDGNHYQGKLVVLVNENSQSQAEFTALAFRAVKNVTVIGSSTAGADGNVSDIYLPGGLQTRISGIGVYYPDGKQTQRIGITPDIIIKPTIEGIKKGKDEVLEKALVIAGQ